MKEEFHFNLFFDSLFGFYNCKKNWHKFTTLINETKLNSFIG